MAQPSNKRFLLESDKGAPEGLATLDTNGRMPDTQVPDRLTEPSLSATYAGVKFDTAIPAGLGWDTDYNFTATVHEIPGTVRQVAEISLTPETVFGLRSTALSAPAVTYWVDIAAGDNSRTGLSEALAVKEIQKAVGYANAGGVPAKIMVKAGTYPRTSSNPYPTVDLAFVAHGGRVNYGVFDAFAAPTRDATYTNTYSYALTNVNRVVDLTTTNEYGNYVEFVNVATAAACNATPNSWTLEGGKIYINRRDQVAVTNTNTRVFRATTDLIRTSSDISLYLGGADAASGFDLEGGILGALDVRVTTPTATKRAIVANNCSFKYVGGVVNTTGRGTNSESINGISYFYNCRADANANDGFNFHNANGAANSYALTVNCTADDNGRVGFSCNPWTLHENLKGIDVAGHYVGNRGGLTSINTSKAYLAGTSVANDKGDIGLGGVIRPTAFYVYDTAQYWAHRTRVDMPAGTRAYVAEGGAAIHKRDTYRTAIPNQGTGTHDTY